MYRKSVDHGQQSSIQITQFSCFKRKSQPSLQFIVDSPINICVRVSKMHNSLLCYLVLSQLLHASRSKLKKMAVPTFANSIKHFADFSIDNVPKAYYNYQHEMTMEQFWKIISSKAKDVMAIQDLWVNYSIVQFMVNCYGRKCIRNFMDSYSDSNQQLDLLGNQNEILNDYNIEIRGKLLDLLARTLKIYVSVVYRDAGSQLDDSYVEYYGDKYAENKVQIVDVGSHFKITLSSQQQLVKLTSIQSSTSIMQQPYYHNSKKQAQSLDTTIQGQSQRQPQSKSANKDIRCSKCSGKSKCQCEKQKQKQKTHKKVAGTPKQIVVNTPVIVRSIFDSIGMGNGPKRQTSNHQISATKK